MFSAKRLCLALCLTAATSRAQSSTDARAGHEREPAPAPRPNPAPEAGRLPAFIVLSVGGALGGMAVVTGLVALGKYDDAKANCSPVCNDDQLAASRGLAITSTALTGAAVLSVGLGVVLLATARPESSTLADSVPRLNVAVGPKTAAASAAWAF